MPKVGLQFEKEFVILKPHEIDADADVIYDRIRENVMYKILLVEDDPVIAAQVQKHLRQWNYEVTCAEDFKCVLETFTTYQPHLVILDILLPYYNGFYWCAQIRKDYNVPILFLSSACDNMNIVMAVNMGGDDFVEKPFDLNVLTAKIQALLRRTYEFAGGRSSQEYQGVMLHLDDATVEHEGKKIDLTKNEFKILQILMEQGGRIVKRERIMERLWESDEFVDDNTLTVNMGRLRRKLEEIGVREFIKTKKGIGYLLS